jgi:hypothetical protein
MKYLIFSLEVELVALVHQGVISVDQAEVSVNQVEDQQEAQEAIKLYLTLEEMMDSPQILVIDQEAAIHLVAFLIKIYLRIISCYIKFNQYRLIIYK